jgi:outer membrane protein assembly factor BamA
MQDLKGRRVQDVIVRGNSQVPTAVIRNQIRSRPGDAFDPATVAEDYQRVFGLRKFANVEARAEPTPTGGVNVIFVVTEQRQIKAIRFRGAAEVAEPTLRAAIDVREGDAIDGFRISLARTAIEGLYREQNYALAHVTVDEDALSRDGVLIFNIVEGPAVRIRKIRFVGATSYTNDKLKDQIKSGTYLFIFSPGRYNPEQIEDDVASIRRFYESKGFFDVRVGRKIIWSPDLSEVQIDFLIDEGPHYKVDKVTFQRVAGDTVAPSSALGIPEAELRSRLKLLEGANYDNEALQRDVREIVRSYSNKFGYIYFPGSDDPDYLRVETRNVFRREPGKVELIYRIHEGKEFRLGNIYVKGNYKSQDKLVYRDFRDLVPGERFNSALMQDAAERIRRRPYFQNVSVTPIGNDPNVRDLLVEVVEQRTAQFNIGAGVNSNGGLLGNLTFEQRNFDIGNPPASLGELFSERAFTGAGQNFKASFEPGTIFSGAYVRFSEPFLFDQNIGFTNEFYLRNRIREAYDDRRLGDTVGFEYRYNYNLSVGMSLRGETVKIHGIEDERNRPEEILEGRGKSTLTSVGLQGRYETIDFGLFPTRGTVTTLKWENVGALGGDHAFNRYTLGFEAYQTIGEDLLDRKTVLSFRGGTGYIAGSAPFFERFYGGGIGSMRGFQFRGISPRAGREDDPIGGEFYFNGTVEVGFPISGDNIRGVVFTDFGTVEPDVRFGNVRTAAGFGVRVLLPFLGQAPLAIDFAYPLTKESQDETQYVSFSFGFIQ